jgi:O-acetyl-ADP-ribose deacetylase
MSFTRSARCEIPATRARTKHWSCYVSAIGPCRSHGLASVAFPAIATGIYRFPADRAARIAVSATVEALQTAPGVSLVVSSCFANDGAALHAQALVRFGSPCAARAER